MYDKDERFPDVKHFVTGLLVVQEVLVTVDSFMDTLVFSLKACLSGERKRVGLSYPKENVVKCCHSL